KEQMVSGQIDRLCITHNSVFFADFKTGLSPENYTDIKQHHLLQMALYQKLLQTIYPDKNMHALLIYIKQAKIFKLIPEKLDALLDEIIV
ncbi:MAG: PD-(D/E)XK nuclease family protein, partial [Bartonella sp.]|nr:PD-(D/E)XK nuclease family protein [Bartonella sp.]